MPRHCRLIIPGLSVHLVQRGNNNQPCFHTVEDYQNYLVWLKQYSDESGCAIHAYALMANHVHLLVTPHKKDSLGNMMKGLNQRYAQYINSTYSRKGKLWNGRFRSCIVQQDNYLLSC